MADSDVKFVDVQNTCRVCLCNSCLLYEIFDIFKEKQPSEEYQKISDVIYYCTGFQVEASESFPSKICQNCHSLLQSAYEFKTRFLKSDQTLKQSVNKTSTHVNLGFDDFFGKETKITETKYLIKEETRNSQNKDEIPNIDDFIDDDSFHNDMEIDQTIEIKSSTENKINVTEKKFKIDKYKLNADTSEFVPVANTPTEIVDIINLDDPSKDVNPERKIAFKKLESNSIVEKLSRFSGLKINKVSNPVKFTANTEKCITKNRKISLKAKFPSKPLDKKVKVIVLKSNKSSKNIKFLVDEKASLTRADIKHLDQHSIKSDEDKNLYIQFNGKKILLKRQKEPYIEKIKKVKPKLPKEPKPERPPVDKEAKKLETCVCEHCGISIRKTSYSAHKKTHFPPTFPCEYPNCNYRTWRHSGLRRHMLKHTDVRTSFCQKCPKSFKSLSQLKDHERIVHGEKERNFKCLYCTKSYYTDTNLKMHVNIKHNNSEIFRCEECDSGFSERQLWRKHMSKVHNIEVPFAQSGRKRNMLFSWNTEDNLVNN